MTPLNELSAYGQIARQWRVMQGITLKQMAEGMGVNQSFLCDVEHGRRNLPDHHIANIPWPILRRAFAAINVKLHREAIKSIQAAIRNPAPTENKR